MAQEQLPRVAVVSGDLTMDWNLARAVRSPGGAPGTGSGDTLQACWQRGGAALLADLVEAVAESLQQPWTIHQPAAPREPVHPGDGRFIHSYAMWSQFPYRRPAPSEPRAWRAQEFLGYAAYPGAGCPPAEARTSVPDDPLQADLVLLDDAGPGFRDCPALWPRALGAGSGRPWVLVKMSDPLAQGKLWERLQQDHADRLVVVTSVNNLRRTEVQISRELSWERTAQDLFWEVIHNYRVNTLARCRHLIVSFGLAGAVLLSRIGEADGQPAHEQALHRCFLFFDPSAIEGTYEQEYPGGMIGYNACLSAAVARQLMLCPEQPDIAHGVHAGLAAMRCLHREGYGERGAPALKSPVVFPLSGVVAEMATEQSPFAVVDVQNPVRFLSHERAAGEKPPAGGFWTILEDRYPGSLDQVAEQIAIEGAEIALQGVPLGRFGALLTVDRREIESFRSVRTLMAEYCAQEQAKRPLSIAVFGAPGSGKSFGITQVAGSLLSDQVKKLEFNLSQLGSADELLAALHQVRDAGLAGKIPLVFWDEFDTALDGRPLGWLRYFLAPMQDGAFQEGQILHPIGRAIFVFAGGTSQRMAGFGGALSSEDFCAAKGPDFVSRLKGYVDVLGPNPRPSTAGVAPAADPYYVVRRAILLRAILKGSAPRLFEKKDKKDLLRIDPAVLNAFLHTREYRHGARSLEAIVAMSLLAGKSSYEQSSLPAEAQLDLHVDGQEFLRLVRFPRLEGALLEKLARANHAVFCEAMWAKGYRAGPVTDEAQKLHSALVPFDDLPEEEKEQNRLFALDIPHKLSHTVYAMLQARSNEPAFGFPGDALEMLAALEHDRWMAAKLRAGWQFAPETDKPNLRHKLLVPWAELPEEEKEKDRELVRRVPDILARVGYTIVQVR